MNNTMNNTKLGGPEGSSTGAPGAPLHTQDPRSQYNPTTTGYNPATGAGYSKPSAGGLNENQPTVPTNSYDRMAGQDERIQHAPSTVQRAQMGEAAATSKTDMKTDSPANRVSHDLGRKAQEIGASVHGAGESLRGTLTATVDRAFGSSEGAERNEEIARRGEREVQTGGLPSNGNIRR
ncbi:uncharacterized protein N7482_005496 [Penicillium canariense]|uniref:Uncharacterized protein n=1 Tax=Penicillium canariense TaxID=189055 RepID=A0A9W9I4Z7_9EURO|nr:uncharacterized protein N7482_005496 [Penicillium canariense]KAJ5166715.1 hypothetical protein N7482_005496 [Penicillium canariense]